MWRCEGEGGDRRINLHRFILQWMECLYLVCRPYSLIFAVFPCLHCFHSFTLCVGVPAFVRIHYTIYISICKYTENVLNGASHKDPTITINVSTFNIGVRSFFFFISRYFAAVADLFVLNERNKEKKYRTHTQRRKKPDKMNAHRFNSFFFCCCCRQLSFPPATESSQLSA